MADSRDNKGDPRKGAPNKSESAPPEPSHGAGRVVHDERGNAVWNWVKDTGRVCIDSTSALLKRLNIADLKIEGEKDEELRLDDEPSRDVGGGYDPYNQQSKRTPGKPPGRK